MSVHSRFANFVFAAAALFAAPVSAQLVTTTYGPFSISTSTGTQLSGPLYTINNVTTTGTLQVRYNASATHCSDVRTHIFVDGVERGVTAFLAPGQSSAFVDVGPVASGVHVVALQGEGRVGGCNVGALVGWGGTADITTAAPAASAPAEIPAPGLLATLLAFTAGAWVFGPWRRRRP